VTVSLLSGLVGIARLAYEPIRAWRRKQVTYRELMALDDHQLADIGVGRGEIARVALIGRSHTVRPLAVAGSAANANRPYAA
jgi:uncharacterized protein YjiS (DUF1127 family)